jgi:tetratricopeptide (TPR) repeat protein
MSAFKTWRILIPALIALVLIGAAPNANVEDLLRQGNQAFARKDYASAVRLYTQAEPFATDPGHVAFNKAAALYEQGDFRQAERAYRCALEGAVEPRLSQARYGLATCLVRQGRELGPKALLEAVNLYEQCLRQEEIDPDLATDARHNLEVAKLLWLEAQARTADRPEEGPDVDTPKPTEPPGKKPDSGGTDPGTGRPDPRGTHVPVQPDTGSRPTPTHEPPGPGKGTLPPIPDDADLPPLSAEDAVAHLDQAATKIARERHTHRKQSVKPVAPGVKDW